MNFKRKKKTVSQARIIGGLLVFLLFSTSSVLAAPTKEWVQSFVTAYVAVKQPKMNQTDLENYFSYLADDLTDFHAAYGVTIKGKERKRQGMIKKAQDMVAFRMTIEDMIIGSQTAVVVVIEDSEYYKGEQLKQFRGRTILLLEFNDEGLISHMRRYLD